MFNGTYTTNRLYLAISAKEINPTQMAEPGFEPRSYCCSNKCNHWAAEADSGKI